MRTALTIAGSDSGGGAGIQADLKTFAAYGVYGTSAVTAVTAQNTLGVTAWEPVSTELVIAQIEAVAGDIGVHAVKTGMLATAAIVEAVAAAIEALDLPNLVVDPVMIAKGGDRLLVEEAIAAIKAELLRRAMVVTPNIPEAEVLAGSSIRSLDDMRTAAAANPRARRTRRSSEGGASRRTRLPRRRLHGRPQFDLTGPRIPGPHTHGTGCTFAAAIAAYLALGQTSRWRSKRRGDTSRGRSGMRRASAGVMDRSTISGGYTA